MAVFAWEELRKPLTKARVQLQEQTDGVTNDTPPPHTGDCQPTERRNVLLPYWQGLTSSSQAEIAAGKPGLQQGQALSLV